MYFKELSKYQYNSGTELDGVLNIGWLESTHDFNKGPVLSEILVKLRALAVTKTVNQTRGFHYCGFCQKDELKIEHAGEKSLLGSAEIWIPGKQGELFASPDMIVHYIEAHSYQPPAEFLKAVADLDIASWFPPANYALELRKKLKMETDQNGKIGA